MTNVGNKVAVKTEVLPRKTAIVEILRFIQRFLDVAKMQEYINKGVVAEELISEFTLYSRGADNLIYQELTIKIDWNEYTLKLSNKEDTVEISQNKGVIGSLSPEFLRLLGMYQENLNTRPDLKLECWLTYRTSLEERAREKLGTSPGSPDRLKFADSITEVTAMFGSLSEVSAKVRLAPSIPSKTHETSYSGLIVHLSDHYGFARPKGWEGERDFWFKTKHLKIKLKKGDQVTFQGVADNFGRLVATNIRFSADD